MKKFYIELDETDIEQILTAYADKRSAACDTMKRLFIQDDNLASTIVSQVIETM
jgi:hypothetical protein